MLHLPMLKVAAASADHDLARQYRSSMTVFASSALDAVSSKVIESSLTEQMSSHPRPIARGGL